MARKPAFVSHSPEREAQIQDNMRQALEAKFRRGIAERLDGISGDLLAGYRELGYVPPPSDDHFAAIRSAYHGIALASTMAFGQRIITRGKAAGVILETKQIDPERLFIALANAWVQMEAIRRRITSVTETTRERIVQMVAQGVEEGLSVDEIAALIADRVPGINRWRGALIARTETHGASNFAAHETAKASGLTLTKTWVSVEDHRTRDSGEADGDVDEYDHRAMNGQTVDMDEPFLMPWRDGPDLPIMYPGEAGKPGGAVINCRCASVHSIKDIDDLYSGL